MAHLNNLNESEEGYRREKMGGSFEPQFIDPDRVPPSTRSDSYEEQRVRQEMERERRWLGKGPGEYLPGHPGWLLAEPYTAPKNPWTIIRGARAQRDQYRGPGDTIPPQLGTTTQ
jgi:hypothetical protein